MGTDRSLGARLGHLPWWASASAGVLLAVLLTVPVASRFGEGTGRFYGWYSSSDGSLHTGLILDQVQYVRLVDSTAGRAQSSEIAPFTARALAPWLAGKLPVEPHLALTLVNLGCLALGTFALARLASDLARRRSAVLLAVLVWSVSFPLAKYAGDAFVDPAAVGLLPVVMLAAWRRKWVPALLMFAAAVWMKETAVVLLPVALALIWLKHTYGRAQRWLLSLGWLLVAAVAYLTAEVPGGPHSIVFAPWVPDSFTTVGRLIRYNLLTLPRLLAFAATGLPAAVGVALWWRGRRVGRPVMDDGDAVPLVIGCAAGLLVALSALPTAVLDGRSVWTTLPMGALLLSGWWAARDRATARTDLTSIARGAAWPVTGLAVLWLVVVAFVTLPTSTKVLGADYEPRFAGAPAALEDTSTREFEGEGSQSLNVPGEGPVLLSFEGDEPVGLGTAGAEMTRPGRVRVGRTLLDPGPDRTLAVSTEGAWRIVAQPVSNALFWEQISPITGEGPNVVLFPGGLPGALELSWSADDPDARVMFVGGCRLGTCGELGSDGVVPAGTEALVVDASGAWAMAPLGTDFGDEQPILPETASPG
jgi:hypothetical protein